MRKTFVLTGIFISVFLIPPFARADGGFQAQGIKVNFDSVIERVLLDHAQIRRARARLEREEALLRAVKRGFFPKLQTEIFAAGTSEASSRGVLFWTFGLRVPIFEGGRRIHEVKKQSLRVLEEKEHSRQEERELIYQIKTIYINTLKEMELVRLAQGWVREADRYWKTMKVLHDNELMGEEEFLKSVSLRQAARLELLKHKEAMDYGESLLSELMGLGPGERLRLEAFETIPHENYPLKTGLEKMRKEHPLYEILDLKIKELGQEKKMLGSDRFPKLSLVTRFNAAQDNYLDQNRFEFGIMGTWNIWDFGVLGSQMKAKEAEVKEAQAEKELEIHKLEHDLRKLISARRVSLRKIKMTKSLREEKLKEYENQKTRFIVGEKSGFEILDSFAMLTKVQMEFVSAISDYRLIQAEIQKMTGGGIRG